MLLLLIAPCAILLLCDPFNMDFMIGLCIYGILFLFNMIYAFLLPRLGFTGKQLLFRNLLLQLSSAMFGFSGFLWCRRYGTLTKSELVVSTVAQLIPCIDVIGSVLCYIMFRKEGQPKDRKEGYPA